MASVEWWLRTSSKPDSIPLVLGDRYDCPVCHSGKINPLPLMDAFGCDFCRHIFSLNQAQQSVEIADTVQHLQWRWTGWRWQPISPDPGYSFLWLWILIIILSIVPGTLVLLSTAMFPPLPGSRGAWFPVVWVVLTFAIHAGIGGWLLGESLQWPLYVKVQVFWRRFQQRLSRSSS
jgi:hypothetical protein